ncbi:BgTH12-04875, partial [Blumeria graminis f. sp. triticale]
QHYWRDARVLGELISSPVHKADKIHRSVVYGRKIFYALPMRRFVNVIFCTKITLRFWSSIEQVHTAPIKWT